MSKPVKQMVTDLLKGRYEGFASACVIDMTGMSVQEQEKLRGTVRAKNARVQVVKNSLARRAFSGGPLEPLGGALEGPCALVVGSDSVIDIAKTLVEAAKEFKKLKLKHAIFEGDPELLTVEILSKMKGKNELLGEVAMLVSSPGRSIAGCLSSPQSKIAGCLKAMIDKAA
jgi:large subunit ribosomal protein L10